MVSELALWQEVSLFALALLSLVYIFYFRIWVALATGSDLLFACALLVCIASIAVPELFDEAAGRLVDVSPLPAALLDADARVTALESLPQRLIDTALEQIGYEREERPTPSTSPTTPPTPTPPEPGPFESRVRPAVEALLALIFRSISFVSSFFLLLMALALRSSTATARELQKLTMRLETLSERGAGGEADPAPGSA